MLRPPLQKCIHSLQGCISDYPCRNASTGLRGAFLRFPSEMHFKQGTMHTLSLTKAFHDFFSKIKCIILRLQPVRLQLQVINPKIMHLQAVRKLHFRQWGDTAKHFLLLYKSVNNSHHESRRPPQPLCVHWLKIGL